MDIFEKPTSKLVWLNVIIIEYLGEQCGEDMKNCACKFSNSSDKI